MCLGPDATGLHQMTMLLHDVLPLSAAGDRRAKLVLRALHAQARQPHAASQAHRLAALQRQSAAEEHPRTARQRGLHDGPRAQPEAARAGGERLQRQHAPSLASTYAIVPRSAGLRVLLARLQVATTAAQTLTRRPVAAQARQRQTRGPTAAPAARGEWLRKCKARSRAHRSGRRRSRRGGAGKTLATVACKPRTRAYRMVAEAMSSWRGS